MTITLYLDVFWLLVGSVATALAGVWGFRRVKSLF